MGFTSAPRDLGQGILCVVNTGGNNAMAVDGVAGILTGNRLLDTQAAGALGQYLWENKIVPEL